VVVALDYIGYLFSLSQIKRLSQISFALIPQYEWIKEGKDWVRVEKPLNKWKGIPPIEDDIKKPLNK
jgi:hypothetical protein